MYDRNGLELSPVAESNNAYKLTSLCVRTQMFNAYARSAYGTSNRDKEFTMCNFARFKDPRDAAHAAQEFSKQYDKYAILSMVTDGTFREIAGEFAKDLDYPEWKYPAEGMTIQDILGESGYKINRVCDSRAALVEAFQVLACKPPAAAWTKVMIDQVDVLYEAGLDYRTAARQVVQYIQEVKA